LKKDNYKQFLGHSIFNVLSEASKNLGVKSYVVGGFVRDCFLNRAGKDIDVVTIGSGIDFALKCSELLPDKPNVSVFKNFGTAMFKAGDWEVETVGARKESYRSDSRKPIVEDGTLEDDQLRRDFTINALAFSLNSENFGELLDPFEGINDLENKIVKTPTNPDITFSDDPLRILRAIRFASQLNFTIEENCFQSIIRNKERLKIISQERITEEFNKILLSKKPSIGLKLLFDTKILHDIFPQLVLLQVVETIGDKSHKDNFYHTLEVLDNISLNTNDLWLRWAALLHDIAKPQTKRFDLNSGWTFHGHEDKGSRMVPKIFAQFKLPLNEKMKYVQKLVLLHLRPIVLSQEIVTDSAVRRLLFDAGDDIDDLMLLCNADITSKNAAKVKRHLANFEKVREKLKEVEEKDKIRNWQPPISGEDIMQIFSLKPGREIGILKNLIREAILEGEISNTKEQAYSFLVSKAAEMGFYPTNN
jgi:putative nucleotidyltransferase with HDIG domain